jgi:hypothetical protein
MWGRPVVRVPARSAVVAQLVEQLIRNQQVTGSSPVNGSRKSRELADVNRSFAAFAGLLTQT